MRVKWTVAALSDLERVRIYIGHFNPTAARRMAERLVAAADSLADFPERGRPIGSGRRELIIVHPYVIRYRVLGDQVLVLRIRHGRQASAW
jgi:toxin ParE1/3/4